MLTASDYAQQMLNQSGVFPDYNKLCTANTQPIRFLSWVHQIICRKCSTNQRSFLVTSSHVQEMLSQSEVFPNYIKLAQPISQVQLLSIKLSRKQFKISCLLAALSARNQSNEDRETWRQKHMTNVFKCFSERHSCKCWEFITALPFSLMLYSSRPFRMSQSTINICSTIIDSFLSKICQVKVTPSLNQSPKSWAVHVSNYSVATWCRGTHPDIYCFDVTNHWPSRWNMN